MFEITLNLSTAYGDLIVATEVEGGHYSIGTVPHAAGLPARLLDRHGVRCTSRYP